MFCQHSSAVTPPSRRPADLLAAASADMHMIQHLVKRCEGNLTKRNDRNSLPDGRKHTQHPGLEEIPCHPLRTLGLMRIVLQGQGAARSAADAGQAPVFTCTPA